MFNFTVFKSVMDISDIDESSYAFILRSVIYYIKRNFNIDIDTFISSTMPTISGISNPLSEILVSVAGQVLSTTADSSGNWLVTTNELTNGNYLVTITETTVDGIINTSTRELGIDSNTVVPIDLQYAMFQHAKYLFEVQKKSLNTISAVKDTTGNHTTYKLTPPITSISVYREYSTNSIAFI